MSKQISPSVLKKQVFAAMKRSKESMLVFMGNENPTVVKMYIAEKAKYEAYRAVYEAMNGSAVLLKIDAGELGVDL
jgi:hypothetical protein